MGCFVAIILLFASFLLVIYLADTSVRESHRSQPQDTLGPVPSQAPDTTEPTPPPTPVAVERTPLPASDSIAFGTGGANCTLVTSATTFSTRDRIRLVSAGVLGRGDVSIVWLQRDGRTVDG
jgi:hypothetical protein